MNPALSFWKTFPRKSTFVFLAGVFFTFSTVGIASDLEEMGRQPALRYLLMVLISGVFTAIYAAAGLVFRKKMWKVFFPIFAVHMLLINLLHDWLPSFPLLLVMNSADVAHLQSRLTFDARGLLIAIALGYSCFVYVFVSEGRRYFRVHAEMELAAEIHHILVPAYRHENRRI